MTVVATVHRIGGRWKWRCQCGDTATAPTRVEWPRRWAVRAAWAHLRSRHRGQAVVVDDRGQAA